VDAKTDSRRSSRAAVTVVLAVLATALLAVGFALVAAAPTAAATMLMG
jgi:hypothetical protein